VDVQIYRGHDKQRLLDLIHRMKYNIEKISGQLYSLVMAETPNESRIRERQARRAICRVALELYRDELTAIQEKEVDHHE